jgi:putative aminophosphonate oxidoreductase
MTGPGDGAPVRSLWLQEALRVEETAPPALEGEFRANVCIVGGGYTGLWTALRLKELEPSVEVALIEADVCGGGASGRNGGFVLSWWPKFHTLQKVCGTKEALHLAHASADAVRDIGKFCADHGIDAHYHLDGYLWAATNSAQVGSWRPVMRELERVGVQPFVELDPAEVARRSGSPVHMGGALEEASAIVQPALLARGLRRVAIDRGVRVFERSPMTRLDRAAGRPSVVTPQGMVRADRVVVAMNAWSARFAEVRTRIVVVGSDIVATEPAPDRLAEIGWADGLSISDSRLLVHYYRTTDDGRIAFGKGGGALGLSRWVGARFEGESRRRATVERAFRRTYPMLGDIRIARTWTGPIDRTRTGLPFFWQLGGRPDVVVGVGYSGNGVGPSYLGGRILASLALRRDDEWSRCGLVRLPDERFPPEPFRFVGGHVVRAAIARKERAEDAGRRADPVTKALVGLAPAGLVPVDHD